MEEKSLAEQLSNFRSKDQARQLGQKDHFNNEKASELKIHPNPPVDFADLVKKSYYLVSGGNSHIFKIVDTSKTDNEKDDYNNNNDNDNDNDNDNSPKFVLKIIPYQQADMYCTDWYYYNLSVKNPLRSENVEVLQTFYLEQLLLHNAHKSEQIITPHLSLPVTTFRCPYSNPNIEELVNQIEELDREQIIKLEDTYENPEKISLGEKNNPNLELLFFISEFSEYGDVNDWLEKENPSPEHFSILLFQLIYTFACLQTLDPSFRHNDLSLTNVLVQHLEIAPGDKKKYYHYRFRDSHFLVPVTDFSVRLWDFDFSNSETVPNRKVFCGPSQDIYFQNDNESQTNEFQEQFDTFSDVGILRKPSLQYDLHYFFDYLKNYQDYYHLLEDGSPIKNYIHAWTDFTNADKKGIVEENRLTTKAQLKHLDPKEQQIIAKKKRLNTKYMEGGKPKTIPYYQFTAAYSLENCDFFNPYRTTQERLIDYDNKGLILAHYGFS